MSSGPSHVHLSLPAGRHHSYQSLLRIIGAYLDAAGASHLCLIELPDGIAARYQGAGGDQRPNAQYFPLQTLDLDRARMEARREAQAAQEGQSGRYQDTLRALGWELDDVGAHTVTLDEIDDGFFVSYLQPVPASGSRWVKRMVVLGGSETATMLNEAHARRRTRRSVLAGRLIG